jgi:hypothetical protein
MQVNEHLAMTYTFRLVANHGGIPMTGMPKCSKQTEIRMEHSTRKREQAINGIEFA